VEFIAEDRKQVSLDEYFGHLADEQLHGLEAIAVDMWEPYLQSIRTHVP
jgi:transposase